MRMFTRGLSLLLFGFGFLGLTGCAEDNEAAIKAQARAAKGTIPGSRTAQAQTQEEYFEITPGVKGAGLQSGPRPDQGKGYVTPGINKDVGAAGSGRRSPGDLGPPGLGKR